jgi:phosphoglycolate phosphatase-like HAD superfamily hydrolase
VSDPRFAAILCDLDGTLLDSDDALVAPFVALGVPADQVRFGALPGDECARLGVPLASYLAGYDCNRAQPYAGVDAALAQLGRWSVCSNKHGPVGRAELKRLGWRPELAWFADDFAGPKQLGPVLQRLGLLPAEVVYVGDTEHDRACAAEAGVAFAIAGWNRRAQPSSGDLILADPADLVSLAQPRPAQGVGSTGSASSA